MRHKGPSPFFLRQIPRGEWPRRGQRGSAPPSYIPSNLIDSPQPQASVTFGLLKRKPLSRSEVW